MKKSIFVLCFILFCGTVFSQAGQQTVATLSYKSGKPELIFVKQLQDQVDALQKASGKKLTANQIREVLDDLIYQKLVIQAAEQDRTLAISDGQINQQVDMLQNRLGEQLGHKASDSEFLDALASQTGVRYSSLKDAKEQLKKQMLLNNYMQKRGAELAKTLKKPTEKEIEEDYEYRKSELKQDATVRFMGLAFKDKAAADRVAKEINGNPQTFNQKYNQKSEYYQAASDIIPKNEEARNYYGQDFLDSIFSLKYDEVSKVLTVTQGSEKRYFIIKITEIYEFKPLLTLDDEMFGPDPETGGITQYKVRDIISLNLFQKKILEEIKNELRKDAVIKINDDNLKLVK